MFSVISNSTNDTIKLGKKLASFLKKGDIVVLSGDLGAGKTKFVSGFLSFFDKEAEVSSPTFTIVNEYNLPNNLNLFHFDVYRLKSQEEFLNTGGDELFDKGISIIEWGELIEDILPDNFLKIVIEKVPDNIDIRKFSFSSNNPKFGKNFEEAFLKWRY